MSEEVGQEGGGYDNKQRGFECVAEIIVVFLAWISELFSFGSGSRLSIAVGLVVVFG